MPGMAKRHQLLPPFGLPTIPAGPPVGLAGPPGHEPGETNSDRVPSVFIASTPLKVNHKAGRPCSSDGFLFSFSGLVLGRLGTAEAVAATSLASGVKAVWDLEKAHRETTLTSRTVEEKHGSN
jgi:hypothetical protein